MSILLQSPIQTFTNYDSLFAPTCYLSSKIDKQSSSIVTAAIFGISIFGQSIFGYNVIYGSNRLSSGMSTNINLQSTIDSSISISSPLQEV